MYYDVSVEKFMTLMLDEIIDLVVENPTEENKQHYFTILNQEEHRLLEEAHEQPPKSREFFHQRSRAFSLRRESATKLINKWVKKHSSMKDCPVSYRDTLNIPFQEIK